MAGKRKILKVEIQLWKTDEVAVIAELRVGRITFDMALSRFDNPKNAKDSGLLAKLYAVAADLKCEISVKGRRFLDLAPDSKLLYVNRRRKR